VLRTPITDASQREIGGCIYLSVNIGQGYAKALYQKLGVVSRQDGVQQAWELGLI